MLRSTGGLGLQSKGRLHYSSSQGPAGLHCVHSQIFSNDFCPAATSLRRQLRNYIEMQQMQESREHSRGTKCTCGTS